MSWGTDYDKDITNFTMVAIDEPEYDIEEFAEGDEEEAPGKAPTLDEIKAKAKAATPAEVAAAVKDIRALLDDPDEDIPAEMRSALEKVYKAGQKRMSEAGIDAEEFHGTHDQSTHAKGGRGGIGSKPSSTGGSRVAAIGNKRDPLNQHGSTPKESMAKANKARKSGLKWTGAAVAAVAILGPSPLALGFAAGALINAGLRFSQQDRHTNQARKLRRDSKVSAAVEGSVVIASGELVAFADDKMEFLKTLYDVVDMAMKAHESGEHDLAMEKLMHAKGIIKKKMLGHVGERKMAPMMPGPMPAMQVEILEEEFAGLPPALAKKVVANLEKKLAAESDPEEKKKIQAKIDKFKAPMSDAMQIEVSEEEFAGLPPALAKKVVENLEKKLAAESDPAEKAKIQAKIDKFKA